MYIASYVCTYVSLLPYFLYHVVDHSSLYYVVGQVLLHRHSQKPLTAYQRFNHFCTFLRNKEEGRPTMDKRKLYGAVNESSAD